MSGDYSRALLYPLTVIHFEEVYRWGTEPPLQMHSFFFAGKHLYMRRKPFSNISTKMWGWSIPLCFPEGKLLQQSAGENLWLFPWCLWVGKYPGKHECIYVYEGLSNFKINQALDGTCQCGFLCICDREMCTRKCVYTHQKTFCGLGRHKTYKLCHKPMLKPSLPLWNCPIVFHFAHP